MLSDFNFGLRLLSALHHPPEPRVSDRALPLYLVNGIGWDTDDRTADELDKLQAVERPIPRQISTKRKSSALYVFWRAAATAHGEKD